MTSPTATYKWNPFNSGPRANTAAYQWSPVRIGLPTAQYTYTAPDVTFAFTGPPPVCMVSPSFVINPPAPPLYEPPFQGNSPPWAGVPQFNFSPIQNINNNVDSTQPSPSNLLALIANLTGMIQSMGAAVNALSRKHNQQQKSTPAKNPGNFTEVAGTRVSTKHRIFNPNDDTQYVDIIQIDAITFKNNQGQTLTWKR